MKATPRISVQKRIAWRDLKSNATPAHWMSDDQLEAITPKMVSLKEIRNAVRLANSATELMVACAEAYEFIHPMALTNPVGKQEYNPAIKVAALLEGALARSTYYHVEGKR